MAHDYIHRSNIEQGIIMVCTPDLYFQEFKFDGVELRSWKHEFLKRLDQYHDLGETNKLLNEFEKNKIKKQGPQS
jgi:genome maintenance exonuclease 1